MKYLAVLTLSFLCAQVFAQDPVSWSTEIVNDGNVSFVSLTANVQDGWYIYSQDTNPEGPVPTEVIIDESESYQLNGEVTEHGDLIKKYDELFELDVLKYKEKVEFRQELTFSTQSNVNLEVSYMICDKSRCLPPKTLEFTVAH